MDERPPMSEFSCEEGSDGPVCISEYGGGRPSYVVTNETGEQGFEVARLLTECLL